MKGLLRQNENINTELSKTKSKFLDYSGTITTLKEEVSWKITKYLEETAESHTQMRVLAEEIKIENFNMHLQIDKQKDKYDHIILRYEEDLVFRQETKGLLDEAQRENERRMQENQKLGTKVDDVELSVLSRMKSSELKFEDKMRELDNNNGKLASVFKKIDQFNSLLEGLKNELGQNEVENAARTERAGKKLQSTLAE